MFDYANSHKDIHCAEGKDSILYSLLKNRNDRLHPGISGFLKIV